MLKTHYKTYETLLAIWYHLRNLKNAKTKTRMEECYFACCMLKLNDSPSWAFDVF